MTVKIPCDIRGPYYPVGDIDWMCRTHDVVAIIRPEARKFPKGSRRREDFYCPAVIEPSAPTSAPSKVTLDADTAKQIATWIDANVSIDETNDGVIQGWLYSLAPTTYPDTSTHNRLVTRIATDVVSTTEETTLENYAKGVLATVLDAIKDDCDHDNDTRDGRDVVSYNDIHVLLTGRFPLR